MSVCRSFAFVPLFFFHAKLLPNLIQMRLSKHRAKLDSERLAQRASSSKESSEPTALSPGDSIPLS